MNRKVWETDLVLEGYDVDGPVNEFLQKINDAIDNIPEELRHSAEIELDHYDDGDVTLYLRHERPMTSEEIAEEELNREAIAVNSKARDMALMGKLKEKYPKEYKKLAQ